MLPAIAITAALFLGLSLLLTWAVHHYPRRSVNDKPDWGKILDERIPTANGKELEVWRIDPEGHSRGVILFTHGWGRNRDRMVARARIFGKLGYTTVLHSARDHGNSDPQSWMNVLKFAEDIESVMAWLGQSVILYGHSAGSVAAAIVASRNKGAINLLFLEACYAHTRPALISLYCWYNPFVGTVFGHMILFWMVLLYRRSLDSVSPARLAESFDMPVMLIHGEKDRRFSLSFARELKRCLNPDESEIYIAKDAGHSDSSKTAGYTPAVKGFIERYDNG